MTPIGTPIDSFEVTGYNAEGRVTIHTFVNGVRSLYGTGTAEEGREWAAHLERNGYRREGVYSETVVFDGALYARCPRALGIVRCAGAITQQDRNDCGGH